MNDLKSKRFSKEMNSQRAFACLLLLLSLTGCNKTEQIEVVQKPVERNIPIKVAIIYKFGGPQAVAREDFYLLNRDFAQIWKESLFTKYEKAKELRPKPSDELIFQLALLEDPAATKLAEAVKPYILRAVSTDFEGNATFENVPTGVYYIYGITQTRSGYAVWSYKVSTDENKTVLLDNKNALYSW